MYILESLEYSGIYSTSMAEKLCSLGKSILRNIASVRCLMASNTV